MIAQRCFDDQKHGGGEGKELVGGKVVELDEPHTKATRTHGKVETIGGCSVE